MKRFIWLGALLCAAPLYAQSYYAATATTTTQVNGAPVTTPASNAYITVCAVSGTTCTPAATYRDQALTQPLVQPFQPDSYGNFGFWAAPAVYRYTLCLPTGCRSYSLPTGGAGGSGGATLPSTSSIVVSTSTVTSRSATASDVASVLRSATGCATAGYVYSPQSNSCVAAAGQAGITALTSDVTAAGSGSVPATVTGVHATAGTLNGVTVGGTTPAAGTFSNLIGSYIANAGYASQFATSANNDQGQGALFGKATCASGCSVVADSSDPAADAVGKIEPNNSWLFTQTVPAGSSLIDERAGGFAVSHFSAPGTTDFAYHTADQALINTQNAAGYGAGRTNLYYDMNPGINGQGSINVPSYSPVTDQDTRMVFGAGTYTLNGQSWYCNGTSDCNFDQRYYWMKPGNPQGSSEDARVHQWNYYEEPAATGVVSAYSADQVTFPGGANPIDIGVGQPLIDTTRALSNSANTGVVNTSGTAVTWVSGTNFAGVVANDTIIINGATYSVASVQSPTGLTLAISAGTQSNAAYTYFGTGQGFATLALGTAVTASTATGNLAYPVNVAQGVSTAGNQIPAYATDFVLSATGYNVGDLVNLNGNCCFIENVALTGAAAGGTAWSSTATYTPANVRAQGGNLYQSNTTNTNSSPSNSITGPSGVSLLIDNGNGTLSITLLAPNNLVVGAPVYLTGTTAGRTGCGLDGAYTIASVSSATTMTVSGASGGYANCQQMGTVAGDWTLLGPAAGTTVATANLRYPHTGGTACANGMVGYDVEVNSQSSVGVSQLGDYRYMQKVTCSTANTITVGAVQNGNFQSFGGPGLSAITLYPAADVTGVVAVASQSSPTVLAVTDGMGFTVGDTVEEAAQAYGKYNVEKEAYNFFNPNAQMDLHQVFLGGYAANSVWQQLDPGEAGIGSQGALTGFQFNVPVNTFAQFGEPPAEIFDLCYGNACGKGVTKIVAANGANAFSYNAATQEYTIGAALNVPALSAASCCGNAVSSFTNSFTTTTSYALSAQQTSLYPAPVMALAGHSGFGAAGSTYPFSPSLQLANLDSTGTQPWYLGVGYKGTGGGFDGSYVLAYNSTFSGDPTIQTSTLVQNCTIAGVCDFPLGLTEAGSPVCTTANGLCGGGGGGGGAGGASFPSTAGLVYNTSATASRTAAASDIAALLGPLTGCSTAGNVYSPQSNTCVAAGSGFTLTTTGTSGPATYSGGVLNIPQYSGGGITSVAVASANGVSGTSSGGATPTLTLSLGAITPASVAATGAVSGSSLSASASGVTASFTPVLPADRYPQGSFFIGESSSDVSALLVAADTYASNSSLIKTQIAVSDDPNTLDSNSHQVFIASNGTLLTTVAANPSAGSDPIELCAGATNCGVTVATSGNVSMPHAVTVGSVTDGTATLSGGSIAGAVNGSFSGTVSAASVTSGGLPVVTSNPADNAAVIYQSGTGGDSTMPSPTAGEVIDSYSAAAGGVLESANGGAYLAGRIPAILYSAAGTPLPTCSAGIRGVTLTVSDAASPTYMGAYTSGGTITAAVICSYNGISYGWLTH